MATYRDNSNYAITPRNRKYLELYEPPIKQDNLAESRFLIIQNKYNKRPDLLAYDLFGSSRLWWVFAHYNRDALKDPVMDFTAGKNIIVPKKYVSGAN